MSDVYYVMTCPFADDDCDEYGYDCSICPFYHGDDDDEE